jgi:D-alanyl-D-alanine carboxypeptidase/D-alanyl-D-alanine-endopeptidase (penicillin-binding protein 4)
VAAALSAHAVRSSDPSRTAAKAFAKLLGGVPVVEGAAAAGAKEIAHVESMSAQEMTEQMLQLSDNVLAEALLRQVAIAKGKPATFAGGSEARKQVLTEAGIDQAANALVDGSGLSRDNKLSATMLTSVLRAAADDTKPKLRGVLAGLPVAAYSGTLSARFGDPKARAAAGEVRAKTGTLTGVNALGGVVVTKSGQQLAFAVVANSVPVGKTQAEAALDAVGAALASCGCT